MKITCAIADNALAETINGLYEAEVIHRRGPWRSFEAVEFDTLEWVDWFNNRRLLEPISNCSEAAKLDRFWLESSAPIPRLGGAQSDEGIEVFGRPEGVHSEARR